MSAQIPFLARQLTRLREAKGFSRWSLARAAGLNLQTYLDIEDGKTASPGWENVRRIADALGVSTDEFREPQATGK